MRRSPAPSGDQTAAADRCRYPFPAAFPPLPSPVPFQAPPSSRYPLRSHQTSWIRIRSRHYPFPHRSWIHPLMPVCPAPRQSVPVPAAGFLPLLLRPAAAGNQWFSAHRPAWLPLSSGRCGLPSPCLPALRWFLPGCQRYHSAASPVWRLPGPRCWCSY